VGREWKLDAEQWGGRKETELGEEQEYGCFERSTVGSSGFDIKTAIHLMELNINNTPDVEICIAVSKLVARTSPKQATPPMALQCRLF